MIKQIAVMHDTREIIATGDDFCQCSDNALATGVWTDYDCASGAISEG